MQRSRDNNRNDRRNYRSERMNEERFEQDENYRRGAESYRPQTEDSGYYTHPYNDYNSRRDSAASHSSYRDTRENWDPNRRNYYDQGRTLSDTGIGTGFSSDRAPAESNRYQDAQRSSSSFDRDATYGSYYGPDAARAGSFGTSNYRDNDMNYGSDRYGSERYSGQNYGGSQGYNQGSRIQADSYRNQRGMGRLSYDRDEDYSSAQSYGYGTDIDRFTKRSSDTEEGYGRDWNAYDSGRITTGPNYAGRGPKGFTRSDERIKEEINDALMRHAGIDASEIEVEVKDGVVTLTGTVPERRMKHMAEDISEKSFSVKDVTNNIRVKKEDRSSSSMSSSSGTSTSSSAASKKGGNPATTGSGH